MFAYCNDNPVNHLDAGGERVAGIGVTITGGFIAEVSGGAMIISDNEGNEATILTGYYGAGTPTISASINVLSSSADTIFDYVAAQSACGGGSFGILGFSLSFGLDQNENVFSSRTYSFGLSVLPGEAHAGIEYARFLEITKYHGKPVPKNVDMSFFSDLPQTHQDMIQRQLRIPNMQLILPFSPVTLIDRLKK